MSHWESLFDEAVSIIAQANTPFTVADSWTFGGGTALMLQINHRESFDIDIFIDDPQVLPYLNPTTQGYTLKMNPDDYESDGTHALKEKAALALNVAENMNEGFARNIMSKLQFRDGYGDIAENAQATTVSLLRSVCGHEPSASASPSSPSPR